MPELNVDLVTPSGMVLEATLLPDDMLTEEVISELVDELGLPRVLPNGDPVAYSIEIGGQEIVLQNGVNLRDGGVSNGDCLRLTTNCAAVSAAPVKPVVVRPSSPLPRHPVTGALTSDTIEVVLSVLDLNKSEKTSLLVDRPVGELLQQIAATFSLPARDRLNELIVYRIESKALGRYLANRETLRQAGVPRLDRLTVHREEIAGAGRLPVDEVER